MAEEKIIGIDLGTTNSVVAVMEGGEVKVIANQEGNRLTPSVVAFTDKGDRLVGDPAKRQADHQPAPHHLLDQALHGPPAQGSRQRREARALQDRRRAGRAGQGRHRRQDLHAAGNLGDDPAQAQGSRRGLPGPHASARRSSRCRRTSTTPSGRPRIDAAAIAGFDTEWEIEDPAPARRPSSGCASSTSRRPRRWPTAWTRRRTRRSPCSTSAAARSTSRSWTSATASSRSRSTNGDTHLGGDDFDQVLIDYIADEFKKENGIDLRKDQMALQRLKEAAERAKKDLSQQTTTDINLPFITADAIGPEAPADVADAVEVRAAGRSTDRAVPGPGAEGAWRTPS